MLRENTTPLPHPGSVLPQTPPSLLPIQVILSKTTCAAKSDRVSFSWSGPLMLFLCSGVNPSQAA